MNMRQDIRVECMRCLPANGGKSKGRTRRVMTWKTAVLHDIEVHSEEPPSDSGWRLVTDEADLTQVQESELKRNPHGRDRIFLDDHCRYCDRRLKVSGDTPESHLSSAHNIREEDETRLKQHLYVGLDLPMKGYPFAVKI
ncbi:hypothetical protein HYPSUDRAFT_212698 [Hypholoma sublateritium FD-334 SS-4]|uniref:Uncharacterized protein n=1 Tax=Hypholoma sublateritium (strain FD-334 SS-4) TaxID=945553 RepID=A0A0D2P7R9_HYPSF|nr:hypothetical protein HYPSUDRAFT_212698 [Hypholoma sublateritium FD-334 SS-4]